MTRLRLRLIRSRTQLGSWIMRPPIDRARTHLILAPHPDQQPTQGEDDVA